MRTRDGRKAVFVAWLKGDQPAPLVVEIWELDDWAAPEDRDYRPIDPDHENFYPDGRYFGTLDDDLDLFME